MGVTVVAAAVGTGPRTARPPMARARAASQDTRWRDWNRLIAVVTFISLSTKPGGLA